MEQRSFRTDDSIEEIIEKYKATIYGIALAHTQNQADADDVFQNVFLVYFKKHRTFNEEGHRKAWLITTALNCCKKISSSSWRKRTISLEEAPEQVFQFSSGEENLVFAALRELPAKYRSVLYLFYFEELSVDEISRNLNVRAGTVRMQLTRGRNMMRDKLKGDYFYE